MAELELTQTPGDRRLFALQGVGTLRFEGLSSRRATAEAGGRTWRIARRKVWQNNLDSIRQKIIEATDSAGAAAGEYESRGLHRGGTLRWAGREYTLRPASVWRERYALADGDDELVILDGRDWGKRPVKVTLQSSSPIEPGLLLFAAFVVRVIGDDAAASTAPVAYGT